MSLLASHSLPRLFASAASISGAISSDHLIAPSSSTEIPEPIAPLPVLFELAKNDTTRPFLGGLSAGGNANLSSFAEAQLFLSTHHCRQNLASPLTETTDFANGSLAYTTDTWCANASDVCPDSYEVRTVALEGGGHIWPDAADNVGYDANAEVTAFFEDKSITPVADGGPFIGIPAIAGGARGPLPSSGIRIINDLSLIHI